MKYYTYILYSESINKYYVGYTNNFERRIIEHNRIKGKFTDNGIPWEIVHIEIFKNRIDAHQRELQIKNKKSRKYIEWIISNKRLEQTS